jgi:hypothetical protein
MKTLTVILAAVVITTSAFAKTNTTITSNSAQLSSIAISNLSHTGNGSSYSGKGNRKARRSTKLLLKNPFRTVSLNRGSRY